MKNNFTLPTPDKNDLNRIKKTLHAIGGPHVIWGAQAALDVWVIEQRAAQEFRTSRQLLIATWALVAATVALVGATLAMVITPR